MIEMNIDAMSEICIELKKKEKTLKGLCESLSETVRADEDLRDEDIADLMAIIRELETDCKNLKKLISVAEKIANLYSLSENKFLSLISTTNINNEKNCNIGINDLSQINKAMEKYHFNMRR